MSETLCTLRTKGGGGGAKQEETVLWTNPNPTSSSGFAAQTVTLSDSISNYDYIYVSYGFNSTNMGITSKTHYLVSEFKNFTLNGGVRHYIGQGGAQDASNNTYARDIYYVSDTSIGFTTGYGVNKVLSAADVLIPTSIIGIKNMGGYSSIKDYASVFATSDGTRSTDRGYTSNSSVFTVADVSSSNATNTITVLEAGNYEYIAEVGNRSTLNAYVKIGDTIVAGGSGTHVGAGNIYIQANTVCTVYTAPASNSINTASLTLIKK